MNEVSKILETVIPKLGSLNSGDMFSFESSADNNVYMVIQHGTCCDDDDDVDAIPYVLLKTGKCYSGTCDKKVVIVRSVHIRAVYS